MKHGLSLKIEKNIAFVKINRPKQRNSLDLKATREFQDIVNQINDNNEVLVAVLSGSHGTFCSGADLKEIACDGALYNPWAGEDGPLACPCKKPVIAAIEGHAVAGGLGVALWADLRVASQSAVFGVFCRRFGVPMSDGTPTRLPGVIGRSRALVMLLTGRPVDANEAFNIGLADRLVKEGEATAESIKIARKICQFPQLAMLADRNAAWTAFDDKESKMLIKENSGAQMAKLKEAAIGAANFTKKINL